jgi:hypothetical protein
MLDKIRRQKRFITLIQKANKNLNPILKILNKNNLKLKINY